jgi:hypothetical protein
MIVAPRVTVREAGAGNGSGLLWFSVQAIDFKVVFKLVVNMLSS